jgi:hypothetical protein
MKGHIDNCDKKFKRGKAFHVRVTFTSSADRDAFVNGTNHEFKYLADGSTGPESWPRSKGPTNDGNLAAKIEFTPPKNFSSPYSLWLWLLRLVWILISTGTGTVHYTDSGGTGQLTDASTKISEI